MEQPSPPSSQLPVMESFLTIQGEGFHQGKAAYFIRLGGCDVGCHWCDVKESWDLAGHPQIAIKDMAENAAASAADIVVVTGGEPLMHNLDALTGELKAKGLQTHIETSGAYPLSGKWDWICVSPKKFKPPLPYILKLTHELKAIIYNKTDFQWAEQHAAEVSEDCKLFLQPEWDKREQMMPLIVDYVKQHPQWRISLQIHKYLTIP